jgi:hypothetical protein
MKHTKLIMAAIVAALISIFSLMPVCASENTTINPITYDGGNPVWEIAVKFTAPKDADIVIRMISCLMYDENGEVVNSAEFSAKKNTDRLPDDMTIKTGTTYTFVDWFSEYDNYASVKYTLMGSGNVTIGQTFILDYSNVTKKERVPLQADPERDLESLRYNADYEIPVYPGVYWVPARSLDDSDYTNAEIKAILNNTPEQKQAAIDTLYEAMQLFQVGGMFYDEDNPNNWKRNVLIDDTWWQYGLPGYDAVRTNQGDCQGVSNWLNYILDGDYAEVGFIQFADADGTGHVFNYILQDGWYYCLDMTDHQAEAFGDVLESGDTSDFSKGEALGGIIIKTQSLESYIDYYLSVANKPPVLFYSYDADDVINGGWPNSPPDKRLIANMEGVEYTILYDNGQIKWEIVEPPRMDIGGEIVKMGKRESVDPVEYLDWSNVPTKIWK